MSHWLLSKSNFLVLALLGLFALSVNAQTKWDLASAYPVSNFHTENLQQLAIDVEKATDGKLKIVVHPNGSLFPANGIKRAVQTGQAQIGEVLISVLANENPIFGVDSIPFLATSYKDSEKLWKLSKNATESALQKQGLKVVYAVPWPPQGLYSKNPINSGADMKGLKWRAYNPATSKIAELVGAQPVTVQVADLAQAMATGTINSMMTSGATGVDIKAWESLKYYYEVDAWLPKNILMINQKAFDALDKPTQAALLKACTEAEKRGTKVSEEKTKLYNETLAKNGMVVQKPSPQLKNDLDRVGRIMVAEWIRSAGDEGQKIIEDFKK
ncbi:MAG: TRAP transporter substrate-binding protein [Polynucleobacter sp.]